MPPRWLPSVWDSDEGEAKAIFADLDQGNRIALLLRLKVIRALR